MKSFHEKVSDQAVAGMNQVFIDPAAVRDDPSDVECDSGVLNRTRRKKFLIGDDSPQRSRVRSKVLLACPAATETDQPGHHRDQEWYQEFGHGAYSAGDLKKTAAQRREEIPAV